MAMTYKALRKLDDAQFEELHDEGAEHVQVGMGWYRDELVRRQQERQTRTMVRLTWVIAGLTLVNVAVVALTLLE